MIKKIVSVISACFILFFIGALLNRTGSLILFWKEEPVGSIMHDSEYGYYTFVQDENISRFSLPFFLKEDDSILEQAPLSVNEDITASIKEKGSGRYQLLNNNDLYFSASDNEPENHEYSIISPVIIRNRYLLAAAFPAGICAAVCLFLSLKSKNPAPIRTLIRVITPICCFLLLLPWDQMTFRGAPVQIGSVLFKPLLQRNIIFIGLLFLLLFIYVRLSGESRFLKILFLLIILCNLIFFFVPEWDWYGLRADSPGYLQKYTASSIRTPGYPVFIETVYRLTGNGSLEGIREEGESIPDEDMRNGRLGDSRGLLSVVRAQKFVLGIAFLFLFIVFCRYYPPIWFAFASQIILCGGFLGADNSYIMTECLSQAALLLTAAGLILTIKEKSPVSFLLLSVISACSIMIRPANIFLLIPLLVSFVFLIFSKRGVLIPIIGCFIFLLITAIPAVTIFRHYGFFVWMPSSGYVEIARAVEIMQPGDENGFDDPEQRAFCQELLALKQEYPDADQNTYMWQVGIKAAETLGYDRITCSPLFGKVSRKIFLLHFKDFAAAIAETVRIALERTRLQVGPVSFTVLLLLSAICFVLHINMDSMLGMGLVMQHVIHLCLSMMNQPERRYIYSTEILCLFGWLLILISLLRHNKTK